MGSPEEIGWGGRGEVAMTPKEGGLMPRTIAASHRQTRSQRGGTPGAPLVVLRCCWAWFSRARAIWARSPTIGAPGPPWATDPLGGNIPRRGKGSDPPQFIPGQFLTRGGDTGASGGGGCIPSSSIARNILRRTLTPLRKGTLKGPGRGRRDPVDVPLLLGKRGAGEWVRMDTSDSAWVGKEGGIPHDLMTVSRMPPQGAIKKKGG